MEYPRCALVMTLLPLVSRHCRRLRSPAAEFGTHTVPLDALDAVMFTDIQSPGLTLRPSMLKAASGYHSHHADALCPPLELTCRPPRCQPPPNVSGARVRVEAWVALTTVVTPACNSVVLHSAPSIPTHAAAYCGAAVPGRSVKSGTVK